MQFTSPTSVLSLTDFDGAPLPPHQLEETFDALMEENGYVYLTNVVEDFDPVAFCRRLGPFVPQYGGTMVGDVRPEAGMEDVYHSGNTKPLFPHTEGYDFKFLPPRYIALWCVAPALCEGGETTLVDGYGWLDELGEDRVAALRERTYEWKTTDGVMRKGLTLRTHHPVVEELDGRTIVRFSTNNLLHDEGDEFTREVIDSGRDYFYKRHIAVNYEQDGMLIWDNFRMMHARNAFSDPQRHLKRIQIGVEPAVAEAFADAFPYADADAELVAAGEPAVAV